MPVKVLPIPLKMIATDGGTQFRDLSEEVVSQYADIMSEKADSFPPVCVVHDGKNYWLWEGFHRYFAAKKVGLKSITASIEQGTKRDAFIKALGANGAHGYQRDKKAKLNVVRATENDMELKFLSDEKKARLTGMTQKTYSNYRLEIEAEENKTQNDRYHPPITQHRTDGVQKHTSKQRQTGEIEARKPKNSNPDKSPQITTDAFGHEIPEEIQPIFQRAHKVKDFINRIDAFKKDLNADHSDDPELWHYFRYQAFETELKNVRRAFRFAMPYAVCVYCGGVMPEQCQACKGAGFINERIYESAPKELKGTKS